MKLESIVYLFIILCILHIDIDASKFDIEKSKKLINIKSDELLKVCNLNDIPYGVLLDLKNFFAWFLKYEAKPFENSSLSVKMYDSKEENFDDLVLFKWDYDSVKLEAICSRNAVDLSFFVKGKTDVEKLTYAKNKTSQFVYMNGKPERNYHWNVNLNWPKSLHEGVSFTSDSSINPASIKMKIWYQRLDAYFENGKLHLIFFNKSPVKRVGELFYSGYNWFESSIKSSENASKNTFAKRIDSLMRGKPETNMKGRIHPLPLNFKIFKGSRTKKELMRKIIVNLPKLKNIYNKRLEKKEELEGNITLKFVIKNDGNLEDLIIIKENLNDSTMLIKTKDEIMTWNFGKIETKKDVTVFTQEYKFYKKENVKKENIK